MWPSSSATSSGPGADLQQLEHAASKAVGSSSACQRSASGSAVVGAERLVDDRAVVGERTSSATGSARPLTAISSRTDLQRPPLVLEQVAVALDPLDEEVLDVGHDVGEGPADVVVLAHVDRRACPASRRRGRSGRRGCRPTWYQMPGMLGGRCGSPAISGPPVALSAAADRPVVGAAGLGGEPDRARARASICSASASPSPCPGFLGRRPGCRPGRRGRAARPAPGPSSRTMSARSSSRSQLVERPKASSLPTARMSTGRQGSNSRRSSCISNGQRRRRRAAAALTPGAEASSRARSSGSSAASSRSAARRMPERAHQAVDRQPLRARHLREPALRPPGGRSPSARAGPGRGTKPWREAEVVRGRRPRRGARPSGRARTSHPALAAPRSSIVALAACGSGRRQASCQPAAPAAAARSERPRQEPIPCRPPSSGGSRR